MFEFTRQTILNSNKYLGKNAYAATATVPDPEHPENKDLLTILGYFKFPQDKVDVVYKRAYREGAPASVTFDLAKLNSTEASPAGLTDDPVGTYRFTFYIGLAMTSQDSFYANNLVYKGKPLYIEFPVKKSDVTDGVVATDKVIARIKSIVNKFQLLYTDEKLLDVTSKGSKITFTGMYDYQIIRVANLEKYNAEGGMTVACCANLGEWEPVITGRVLDKSNPEDAPEDDEVEITPNVEAFGNYAWMIHNLRIPTGYNTRWDAPLPDEAPAMGGKYTQYTFHMNSGLRLGIAGEAVGMGVTSHTVHVFYVESSIADDFEGVIRDAGIKNIIEIPDETATEEETQEPGGNG